jgi:hypothetical protein
MATFQEVYQTQLCVEIKGQLDATEWFLLPLNMFRAPLCPSSGIIAEIFLQHLEDSHIKLLLDSKCIAFYS